MWQRCNETIPYDTFLVKEFDNTELNKECFHISRVRLPENDY